MRSILLVILLLSAIIGCHAPLIEDDGRCLIPEGTRVLLRNNDDPHLPILVGRDPDVHGTTPARVPVGTAALVVEDRPRPDHPSPHDPLYAKRSVWLRMIDGPYVGEIVRAIRQDVHPVSR